VVQLRAGAAVLAMVLIALPSGTAVAASGTSNIRADLEGRPIKVAEISSYFCHDHSFPVIHCFRTPAELEASLVSADQGGAASSNGSISAAFGPSDYVTIYSDPSYGGSFMHLSQNYDTLYWIGWNDRVSSFKGRNNASGTFWSDWYGTGRATDFCCNHTVPYLSAAVDNTFTSVYRG
jgi:hypothetical protein